MYIQISTSGHDGKHTRSTLIYYIIKKQNCTEYSVYLFRHWTIGKDHDKLSEKKETHPWASWLLDFAHRQSAVQNIPPKKTRVAIRHVERCSALLVKRNANQRYSEGPSSKSLRIINVGRSMKEREPSYTVGGNVNWCSCHGEQNGGSLKKLKIGLPWWSRG